MMWAHKSSAISKKYKAMLSVRKTTGVLLWDFPERGVTQLMSVTVLHSTCYDPPVVAKCLSSAPKHHHFAL